MQAEPDVTAKALMHRLCEQFPDVSDRNAVANLAAATRATVAQRAGETTNLSVERYSSDKFDTLSVNHDGEATTNIDG